MVQPDHAQRKRYQECSAANKASQFRNLIMTTKIDELSVHRIHPEVTQWHPRAKNLRCLKHFSTKETAFTAGSWAYICLTVIGILTSRNPQRKRTTPKLAVLRNLVGDQLSKTIIDQSPCGSKTPQLEKNGHNQNKTFSSTLNKVLYSHCQRPHSHQTGQESQRVPCQEPQKCQHSCGSQWTPLN